MAGRGWRLNIENQMSIRTFLILLYLTISNCIKSQDTNVLYRYFQLDSIVIQASQSNLDVKKFIQFMIDDKSFYQSFKNLRTANYHFTNDIRFFKNQIEIAGYSSSAKQSYKNQCRTMEEYDKKCTTNFYAGDGDYAYFTAKMYDKLFFTHGITCDTVPLKPKSKQSKTDKYIQELKTLMFDPGAETHIPLMGGKTNIFDPDMITYYDYNLSGVTLAGRPCYFFDIRVKKEYEENKEGKTIVKKLLTWFDRSSKQIIKREYTLQAKTIAYNFDVKMEIDIDFKNGLYFPSNINYMGEWKVIGRKRENARFALKITEFNSMR